MADNFLKIYKGVSYAPRSTDPSNPQDGDVQFSDGSVRAKGLWQYKDGAWEELAAGTGGAGSLDTFDTEDFEDALFSVNASGNNASFLTAGTFGGSVVRSVSSQLSGDADLLYTSGVSSNNDWVEIKTIDIDPKQQGQYIKQRFMADMSNFSNDVTWKIYDKTNSAELSSSLDILSASTSKSFYEFLVIVPSNCTQISFGFHCNNGATNTETIRIDDIETSTASFIPQTLEDIQYSEYSGFAGYGSTATKIPYFDNLDNSGGDGVYSISNDSTNGFSITALAKCSITLSFSMSVEGANFLDVGISKNASSTTTNVQALAQSEVMAIANTPNVDSTTASVSVTVELEKDDILRPHTDGTSADNTNDYCMIRIHAKKQSDNVITPANSSSTVEKILTADITTNQDISDFQFDNLTVGEKYILTGSLMIAASAGNSTIDAYSGSGATGTYYGRIKQNGQSDTPTDTELTGVSLIFTAASETLYIRYGTNNGEPLNGDGTKAESFLQLTNITAHFLAAVPIQKTAYLEDQKTTGVFGGTFSSGVFQTRDLNTILGDSEIVTLSSNQFTLQKGKYSIEFSAPAYSASDGLLGAHVAKLYNITDSTNTIVGESCRNQRVSSGSVITNFSRGSGIVEITEAKVFELQHRCTTTQTTSGFGYATNLGPHEVYSRVKIVKLR